jgi:hypothetical protein
MPLWGLEPVSPATDSTFYPKRNFYSVISGIPQGASVIFLFGEIDCREG